MRVLAAGCSTGDWEMQEMRMFHLQAMDGDIHLSADPAQVGSEIINRCAADTAYSVLSLKLYIFALVLPRVFRNLLGNWTKASCTLCAVIS